jgi:3',5'-cyclic AMP phosphodiesterase CpdA
MRTIAHLSDLHFGCINEQLVAPLVEAVRQVNPDLVVVSGDLTQRARSRQFEQARALLNALPKPQIVVPGNHDVPLYNVAARFLQPLRKYRRYITPDLRPFFQDDEMAVLGVNTAIALTIKGGRVTEDQVGWMHETFCQVAPELIRIVVTHHPFDLPAGDQRRLVGRARMAMTVLASCGVDVFLAGHLHTSHTIQTATRYQIQGHSALVIQAGTATSARGRGEVNAFNVVRLDTPHLEVERFEWQEPEGRFHASAAEQFLRTPDGWVVSPSQEPTVRRRPQH